MIFDLSVQSNTHFFRVTGAVFVVLALTFVASWSFQVPKVTAEPLDSQPYGYLEPEEAEDHVYSLLSCEHTAAEEWCVPASESLFYVPELSGSRARVQSVSAPLVGAVGLGALSMPQWLRGLAGLKKLWFRVTSVGLVSGYMIHKTLLHSSSHLKNEAGPLISLEEELSPEFPSPHKSPPPPAFLAESEDSFSDSVALEKEKTVGLSQFFSNLAHLCFEVSEGLVLMHKGLKSLEQAGASNEEVKQLEVIVRGKLFRTGELTWGYQSQNNKTFEELGLKLHALSHPVKELHSRLLLKNGDLTHLPKGLQLDDLAVLEKKLSLLGSSFAGMRGRLWDAASKIENPELRRAVRGYVKQLISLDHVASGNGSSSKVVMHLPALARVLESISTRTQTLSADLAGEDVGVMIGYPATLRYSDDEQRLQLSVTLLWLHMRFLEDLVREKLLLELDLEFHTLSELEEEEFIASFETLDQKLLENPEQNVHEALKEYGKTSSVPLSKIYRSAWIRSFLQLRVLVSRLVEQIGLDHNLINAHTMAWDQLSPSARRHLVLSALRLPGEARPLQRLSAKIIEKSLMLQIIQEKAHQEGAIFPLLQKMGSANYYRYDRLFYELSLPESFKDLPLGSLVEEKQKKLAEFFHRLDHEYEQKAYEKFHGHERESWERQQDFREIPRGSEPDYRVSASSRIFITALPYVEDLTVALKELLAELGGGDGSEPAVIQ